MSHLGRFLERFDGMFGDMDSRMKHPVGEKFGTPHPTMDPRMWEPVYCANCGRGPGSYVTKGTPIIYLCLPCSERYGHLPLPMIPGTEDL